MLPKMEIRSAVDVVVYEDGACRPASKLEVEAYARIAELESALHTINVLNDSPSRYSPEVESVIDRVLGADKARRARPDRIPTAAEVRGILKTKR